MDEALPTPSSSTCESACGDGAADRIFEVTLEAAEQQGLIGATAGARLDTLYDAVATMDTSP